MFYKKQSRRRTSRRRKAKSRARKSHQTSIIPALIIESMAVVAILVLFFGVRADLKNQSRMKHRWDGGKENSPQAIRQERRVGLLAQPTMSATQQACADWSCN